MEQANQIFIALGSNKGDKMANLQKAIDLIFERIGHVVHIARVYSSKAMGFDDAATEDFYNTCIHAETFLGPEKLLQTMQAIETFMGRERSDAPGYQSRIIDLDLLYYSDLSCSSKQLLIPHPEMQNRRFVLQPLNDIAPSFVHPILKQDTSNLLAATSDASAVEPINIWLKNPIKRYPLSDNSYVAIEGNIGAGKTSLAHLIANDFNGKLLLERFADNAFLPKFYEEPQRYAFTLEMSFLADRYQQISEDLSQLDLFKDFVISDYDIYKSLIFSKITLPEDEFRLYRKLFYLMYKDISKPDLYVYLYQNTERLQQNIKKRGRDYEQGIDDAYLEKINAGYLDFLRNQNELNVKIIDISDRDFIENRSDYLWLLGEICGGD